ncbi:hypothetical protein HWA77_11130, partial [Photobacterium damselae subsp. damselae]|nr:hypothetical protein [Photobacterium damselae subsp. damselae]
MQLARAAFSDPFSFLGPQYHNLGIALRVWMPGADAVSVKTQAGDIYPLSRDKESGFVLEGDL